MVIDEIIRFSFFAGVIPALAATSLAYANTAKGAPLRALLRDYWLYESGNLDRQFLEADDFPVECLVDVALAGLARLDGFPIDRLDLNLSVRTLCFRNKCRYHLHYDKHPLCGVKEETSGM